MGYWVLWGFAATIVLTTISAAAQGLGLTRMNFPYMLGTIFTPDRDRARLYGFLVHVAGMDIFSDLRIHFPGSGSGRMVAWRIIGVFHGVFVLIVGMSLLPGLHPHMASERAGPIGPEPA